MSIEHNLSLPMILMGESLANYVKSLNLFKKIFKIASLESKVKLLESENKSKLIDTSCLPGLGNA